MILERLRELYWEVVRKETANQRNHYVLRGSIPGNAKALFEISPEGLSVRSANSPNYDVLTDIELATWAALYYEERMAEWSCDRAREALAEAHEDLEPLWASIPLPWLRGVLKHYVASVGDIPKAKRLLREDMQRHQIDYKTRESILAIFSVDLLDNWGPE